MFGFGKTKQRPIEVRGQVLLEPPLVGAFWLGTPRRLGERIVSFERVLGYVPVLGGLEGFELAPQLRPLAGETELGESAAGALEISVKVSEALKTTQPPEPEVTGVELGFSGLSLERGNVRSAGGALEVSWKGQRQVPSVAQK